MSTIVEAGNVDIVKALGEPDPEPWVLDVVAGPDPTPWIVGALSPRSATGGLATGRRRHKPFT